MGGLFLFGFSSTLHGAARFQRPTERLRGTSVGGARTYLEVGRGAGAGEVFAVHLAKRGRRRVRESERREIISKMVDIARDSLSPF